MSDQSTIVIFSSINGIAQSLREADATLPLQEINDHNMAQKDKLLPTLCYLN